MFTFRSISAELKETLKVIVIIAIFVALRAPLSADEPALSLGEFLRKGSAVSESEAIGIAKRFVQAVNEGDAETCGQLFDVSSMVVRQNKDLNVPVDFRDSFVAGVKESWKEFANLRKSGGDYTVLRAVQRDGVPRVIVRMMQQKFSMNYHELMFDRDERGIARISDIYIMNMGETMGAIFRRLLLAGYAEEQSPQMSKLFSSHENAMKIGQSLKRIPTLVETDPKQAIKEIANLPSELRNEKGMLILRLNASSSVDETEYNFAYQAFAKAFPGDPSLDLHSISYHFARGEFLSSRAAAERLRQAVGGDTKLNEVIAMINAATIRAALNYKSPDDADPTKVLRRFIAHPKMFSVREWTGAVSEVATLGTSFPSGHVARFRLNRFPGFEAYVDSFDSQASAKAALEHIDDDPKHSLLFPDSDEETEFLIYRDVRPDNGNLRNYECGKRKGLFAGAIVPDGIPVIISVRVKNDVHGDSTNPLINLSNFREVGNKIAEEAKAVQRILREIGL